MLEKEIRLMVMARERPELIKDLDPEGKLMDNIISILMEKQRFNTGKGTNVKMEMSYESYIKFINHIKDQP